MCLETVTAQYDPPTDEEIEVFKVGTIEGGQLFRPSCQTADTYSLGAWQRPGNAGSKIIADDYNNYAAGFHCFKTLADARIYKLNFEVIVKGRARKVSAVGRQYTGQKHESLVVVVAQELFLESVVEGAPYVPERDYEEL